MLRDAVNSPIRFGTTVEAIESVTEGVQVWLTNGTVEDVDILVGADALARYQARMRPPVHRVDGAVDAVAHRRT